ncbi:MAG: HAMP domain-containing protein [Alteromonadaceae bacterium]|nr:HAMP domain-containing protein [Alteromonadaceae bacterium]
MIKWYKNLNLRWRLAMLIVSVAIYTAITISLAVYYLWTEQIRKQVSDSLQQNTELAAYSIGQELQYEKNNLRAWSQLDVMIDLVTDDIDKRIINTLNLLKKNYNLSGDLVVVNNENKIIASTSHNFEQVANMEGEMMLDGDLVNINDKMIMRVPIYLSITAKDTISGYLILTHPWMSIVSQLATPLNEFLVVHADTVFHFNKTDLLHTLSKNEINLTDVYWEMDNQEKLHSKQINLITLPNKSIYIYGIVNKEDAFKPINATLFLIAMVTLLLLLPILLISVWSSNRFLKPMIDLQLSAEKIAESGDLSIVIPIYTKDEIGRLASVLNKMTGNLKESFEKNQQSNHELQLLTENLETRVQERTQELSKALNQLKNAQSQLVQSEKMSSLGQLVAGIAHELNNPISSVHVNTPMLKQYVVDFVTLIDFIIQQEKIDIKDIQEKLIVIDYDFVKEDIFELLHAQEDAAKRIRDIVLSLRTFSRLDEAEIKSIDINQGIDNTISILRHEIKHRVELHKDYQLTEKVECFPGEINQVILNVLANAAQAIKEKGNIWISTQTVNNMAQICITDDGIGLPQKIIDKVFDPFFTTKPVGVGTGLGLSISYGIIEKHHGHIDVENVSPHGAKFTINIPLKQDKK